MEEDDTKARQRRELRANKAKLVGFSNRLAQLETQLDEVRPEPAAHDPDAIMAGTDADADAGADDDGVEGSVFGNYRHPSAHTETGSPPSEETLAGTENKGRGDI